MGTLREKLAHLVASSTIDEPSGIEDGKNLKKQVQSELSLSDAQNKRRNVRSGEYEECWLK